MSKYFEWPNFCLITGWAIVKADTRYADAKKLSNKKKSKAKHETTPTT